MLDLAAHNFTVVKLLSLVRECQLSYTSDMTSKSPPKRRNAEKTRAKILAAAQKSFSDLGYHTASMRDIANNADVSATMLLHCFGSKMGLFEAALTDAMQLNGMRSDGNQASISKEGVGKLIAQALLDKKSEFTTTSMILLSSNDPQAREIAMRVIKEEVLEGFASWLGSPDATVRALQIFLLTTGFMCYTRMLPILADVTDGEKTLADWLGKVIQDVLDGN